MFTESQARQAGFAAAASAISAYADAAARADWRAAVRSAAINGNAAAAQLQAR